MEFEHMLKYSNQQRKKQCCQIDFYLGKFIFSAERDFRKEGIIVFIST